MKKTLIALAVAASAAVSGSAMAWTANGTGGSVDMGGILSPAHKVTPWEVKVGDAVKGLDAKIEKGQKTVEISLKSAIPLLGIRTQTSEVFHGQEGITPQISYGSAIDVHSFKEGMAPLTLEVKDSKGAKIGKAESSVLAAAMVSYSRDWIHSLSSLYSGNDGLAFFGGLGTSKSGVHPSPLDVAKKVFAEASEHFNTQGDTGPVLVGEAEFSKNVATYSAFYASGIPESSKIKITLDEGACADAPVQWKASLPITVSYM
ncbi:TPA: fimbrial protein [Escherichia coli]|nr:fimbrial protein [Escherichia coli]